MMHGMEWKYEGKKKDGPVRRVVLVLGLVKSRTN